ncbi:hypothetical protein Bbelb_140500 [Branchiostoma belcheri]|nr:hypothetical protein Bbelb_140500 [Branchiostoma belcheri]
MECPIPVVDFLPYSLVNHCADDDQLAALAGQLIHAFSTTGFVYLWHHGIPAAQIERVFQVSEKFFALPKDTKEKYARPADNNHGWVTLERESLNPSRPGDLKEAFNVTWVENPPAWPMAELPEFRDTVLDFYDKCRKLSLHILELVARGLHVKDVKGFVDSHKLIGSGPNATALRLLHYPPVPAETKPDQVRCGEHSDYGSITLLFQDKVPGLEVRNREGVYVQAPIIENAVLVNIGDLMQRWTSDRLVSTKHRVLLPTDRGQMRQSLAFFVHPDDEVMISCLDGSNKYEAITAKGYLEQRFAATY